MLDQKTINEIKRIVFQFLNRKTDKVFLFGSRAIGNGRKFSDIDIGIKSSRAISVKTMFEIEEAFEVSEIPYTIDVVDFSKVAERFKTIANQKIVYLN